MQTHALTVWMTATEREQ